MKHILFVIAGVFCLSSAIWAQEAADYQAWMKDVAATNGQLGKDLAAKTGDAAAADAKKLAGIFAQVHTYWQKKGVDDATKFAADAQAGFTNVADLAAGGKFDDASAAVKTTAANCGGCHAAHRARAGDGSFSMK
jgi:cytochrome c556